MDVIARIALAMGSSWCAGINLYATIFVLGALSRWTDFTLPAGMESIESDWVLWPALVMYVIEFVADKIPAVDTAWDTVHTFLRIPAGAALAATSLGDVPMEVQILGAMVGGTLAGTSHTTKATTRLAAHSTGTSPVVSPTVSIAEDVLVAGTVGLVVANPILAVVFIVFMIVAAAFLLWVFWKLARKVISTIRNFIAPPRGGPAVA